MQITVIISTIITYNAYERAQNVDDVDELSSFRPIITVNNKNKHSLAIILHSKNAHTENND